MRRVMALLALTLSACSTKYQDMGISGGVAAHQMTASTFRIETRGNGYTGQSQVQDYTMLKAAETAKKHGASHFLLITAADASSVGNVTLPGNAQTTVHGNTAYTTYSPAQNIRIFKPGQDAYIRVLTVRPGEQPPPGAISADEVIQFVGSRVTRG